MVPNESRRAAECVTGQFTSHEHFGGHVVFTSKSERLRSILGWMDKYILGKDVAQFRDVTGQDVAVPKE